MHYPYVGLAVSGGHTSLVLVNAPGEYEIVGETVDDAAGEAFDKLAKLLGLGYPGGPLIERIARGGDRNRFALPRPMMTRSSRDFSFSGLKTAALKLVRELGIDNVRGDEQLLADVCASFQEAVVEVLLRKSALAVEAAGTYELAIVGGVACNGRLREAVQEYIPNVRVVFPPPMLCTDNAAMIAGLAYHLREKFVGCELTLNATADFRLAEVNPKRVNSNG